MRPATVVLILLAALLVPATSGADQRSANNLEAQLKFGVDMAKRGLWSEALFRFRQAERLDSSNFRVWNNLAVAYEANGMFDEALDAYQTALRMEPGNRELRRNYSRFIEFYQSFRPEAANEEPAVEAGVSAAGDTAAGDSAVASDAGDG